MIYYLSTDFDGLHSQFGEISCLSIILPAHRNPISESFHIYCPYELV